METSRAHIRPQTTWAPERFTSHVYQEVVAGKPRMSGARSALLYFGLPDDNELVEEYAERKQRMVVGLIQAGQFAAFPDALRLLVAVHAAGIRVAAASSSKNTGSMLSRVRLDRFAEEQGLEFDFIRTGQTVLDLIDVDISGRSFKQASPIPRSSSLQHASWAFPRRRAWSSRTPSQGSQPPRRVEWLPSASPGRTIRSS